MTRMKTNFLKNVRRLEIVFILVALFSTGCKKPIEPIEVCKLTQSIDDPENNANKDTINYTWDNGHIIKAEAIGNERSAVFTYNTVNKISEYKVFLSTDPVPDSRYNFFYNSDATYSKIEYYRNEKLNSVYEFQNSNGRLDKIAFKRADANGQVDPEVRAEYIFSYTNNNVSKMVLTTKDGGVETREYSYDGQPNYYEKMHGQFSIMDYSQANFWTLRLHQFFFSANQNNCTRVTIKKVFNGVPMEDVLDEFIYKPDGKGNLIEITDASGRVRSRYTYECK